MKRVAINLGSRVLNDGIPSEGEMQQLLRGEGIHSEIVSYGINYHYIVECKEPEETAAKVNKMKEGYCAKTIEDDQL